MVERWCEVASTWHDVARTAEVATKLTRCSQGVDVADMEADTVAEKRHGD